MLLLLIPGFEALAERDGYLSILLIGEDDVKGMSGAKGKAAYGRADAILIAALNLGDGSMRMLSVDRDYHVTLPGQGDTKLCLVNYLGGPDALLAQVNALFGLSVDRYAMVNKADMGRIVGKLGGVEIEIRQEDLAATGLRKAGVQKLTQAQAVAYMSGRQEDDEAGDVWRNERQRIVLTAVMRQVFGRGLEGIMTFAQAVLPLMRTNIQAAEIMNAAAAVLRTGVTAPAQDRSPAPDQRRVKYVKAHNVVYVEDMEAEAARVQEFLYP